MIIVKNIDHRKYLENEEFPKMGDCWWIAKKSLGPFTSYIWVAFDMGDHMEIDLRNCSRDLIEQQQEEFLKLLKTMLPKEAVIETKEGSSDWEASIDHLVENREDAIKAVGEANHQIKKWEQSLQEGETKKFLQRYILDNDIE